MPAGDLVTGDYMLELRAVAAGRTTDVHFDDDRGGVTGLFDEPASVVASSYAHANGAFVGSTRKPERVVFAPMLVLGDTETAVANKVVSLRTAWAPSSTVPPPTEQLWFQWPGFGKGYFLGHPQGLVVVDFTKALILRRVPVVGEFLITDPTLRT
ncbi:MAG TPA: hypothetical protein VFK52_10765 [Nocardioidaceae bacterium]|nr:hypothetical protein [Nocardioidaceae bacterium]